LGRNDHEIGAAVIEGVAVYVVDVEAWRGVHDLAVEEDYAFFASGPVSTDGVEARVALAESPAVGR
jgi:hypothetical protein